jgi:hypothetical protein
MDQVVDHLLCAALSLNSSNAKTNKQTNNNKQNKKEQLRPTARWKPGQVWPFSGIRTLPCCWRPGRGSCSGVTIPTQVALASQSLGQGWDEGPCTFPSPIYVAEEAEEG